MKAPTLLLAVGLLAAASQAQTVQDANPLDAAQVLRELETSEKKQADLAKNRRQQLLAQIQRGLGPGTAASRLYEEAVRATQFAGKGNEAQQAADWGRKNDGLLRNQAMQNAIQFHLRYLILGLQRSAEPDRDAAADSFAYASALAAAMADGSLKDAPKEANELLNKPAHEGVFARWLMIEDRLPKGKDWEQAAGNLGGILDKNVRAPWRAAKNPQLLRAWDIQIESLNASAKDAAGTAGAERITSLALPSAAFGRANDKALLGQPNRAAGEILQLVRAHPAHPEWPQWVARLRELVSPPGPAAP
jgi:hypothetical protein